MIRFFVEEIDFKPPTPRSLKQWISQVVHLEHRQIKNINYIFCSDHYLHSLNQHYLSHDTYTDILTFDHSEEPHGLAGDIFISIERITENAKKYNVSLTIELKRVMVHGILHLMGYKDKTPEQRQEMRKKEEAYLSL